MNYNLTIRQRLNHARNNIKFDNNYHIFIQLINEYFSRDASVSQCELSYVAQHNFVSHVLIALNEYYDHHIYSKKSWWQKCLSFWGIVRFSEYAFLPDEEQHFNQQRLAVYRLIKKLASKVQVGSLSNTLWHKVRYFVYSIIRTLSYSNKQTEIAQRVMGDDNYLEVEEVNGANQTMTLMSFEEDLDQFSLEADLSVEEQNTVTQFKLGIEKSIELSFAVNDISFSQKAVNDLSYLLTEKLLTLQVNVPLIIPFGYRTKTGGHGAMIELVNHGGNNFSVNYINTGDGLMAAASAGTQIKLILGNRFIPIRTASLSLDTITSTGSSEHQNIMHVIAKQLLTTYKSREAAREGMNDIVDAKGVTFKNSPYKIKIQTNGTCAFSGPEGLMKKRFGGKLAARFQVFQTKKGLNNLTELKKHPSAKKVLLSKLRRSGVKKTKAIMEQLNKSKSSKTIEQTNDPEQLRAYIKSLKSQLTKKLRATKSKRTVESIKDFKAWYIKKIRVDGAGKGKLSQQAIDFVNGKTGSPGYFFDARLRRRAKKARLAKEIYESEQLLFAMENRPN